MMNERSREHDTRIEIIDHLPDEHRRAAAVIYYSGLEAKLAPVFGPPAAAQEVLPGSFHPTRCLLACRRGHPVGVLGIQDPCGGFLEPAVQTMVRHYGLAMGLLRAGLLMTLDHKLPPGDLYLDGIAVAAAHRGQGIGTALIRALEKRAADNGFATVSLEVIETNPRAKDLYRRLGYSQIATHSMGPFSRLFGFGTTCRMTKYLRDSRP
jgi:ribosomal protein S18 acetylase RimI-like enzyme